MLMEIFFYIMHRIMQASVPGMHSGIIETHDTKTQSQRFGPTLPTLLPSLPSLLKRGSAKRWNAIMTMSTLSSSSQVGYQVKETAKETHDTKTHSPGSSLAALPSMLMKGSANMTVKTSSYLASESNQMKRSLKESVSSIAMLGDGYFLTAAVADLNIKMWRLTIDESDGSSSIAFIRDFSGSKTGVTCLTKVDRKGRFLSGSKCGSVLLFDSRFNCDDRNEGEGECEQGQENQQVVEENRVLLASFDRLERRRVDTIAIIDDGTYVRPTDNVDWSMITAMTKMAVKEGSNSVQRAAQERQIISCSLEFASITGAHRSVKIWAVEHMDKKDDECMEQSEGKNVADIKLMQELEHENVVESLATLSSKTMLLAGDRMGCVTLWKGCKNLFKRGGPKVWQSIRVFSWRHGSELYKVNECMQFGITSLSFLGGDLFISGARGGDLRVWNVNGSGAKDETVHNELIGLSGAHSSEITAVITGKKVAAVSSKEKMMTVYTCGKDGMVLSFMVSSENPIRCHNVVNLGIPYRYASEGDTVSALSLGCLEKGEITKIIVGCSRGSINVLPQPHPSLEPQDALLAYLRRIKEESLTLQLIAENASNTITSTEHIKHMQKYANCFTGSELVSYLVDNNHASTRNDAVMLGRALQNHLSLFTHISNEFELLQDDIRSFYRFKEEFKKKKSQRRISV